MRPIRGATRLLLATLVALAPLTVQARTESGLPALGLMGTVPIYWGEAEGLAEILDGDAQRHWARPLLEAGHSLLPIDYLEAGTLARFHLLMLAQPRALSAEENVALDAWVRAGGRLLLFADPMMTGHSRFSLADRRRPQDIVLLSPILGHWGLRLEFVEDQEPGPRRVSADGIGLPVNLPGRLVTMGEGGECVLSGDGIVARCAIGQGRVTIVADAMLLDIDQPDEGAREALTALLKSVFDESGEIAGR